MILISTAMLSSANRVQSRASHTSADRGIDEIGGAVVHEALWLGQATDTTYPLQVELHGWMPGARASPGVAWTALWEERIEMAIKRMKEALR